MQRLQSIVMRYQGGQIRLNPTYERSLEFNRFANQLGRLGELPAAPSYKSVHTTSQDVWNLVQKATFDCYKRNGEYRFRIPPVEFGRTYTMSELLTAYTNWSMERIIAELHLMDVGTNEAGEQVFVRIMTDHRGPDHNWAKRFANNIVYVYKAADKAPEEAYADE